MLLAKSRKLRHIHKDEEKQGEVVMYFYEELSADAEEYGRRGAEVVSIGKSGQGRDIICFGVGSGDKAIISTAGMHARECVSALVVKKQLEYALEHEPKCRQYFIPLVNPDGAEIVKEGLATGDRRKQLWKANAAGVDPNVNFDANWGTGKCNTFVAGSENYVGKKPFSEEESAVIARFTEQCGARLMLSYHTAGRELYWYFFQTRNYERDFEIAAYVEKTLKYKYKRIDGDCASAGGYKDWCVQKLGIPAFTIELGEGRHPLRAEDIAEDIALNEKLVSKLEKYI
ncbi:MAG: hypothetical protein HFK08_04065 [Clostridia bacterium]|nr:hypothetical protein [Clostridia bacterium]